MSTLTSATLDLARSLLARPQSNDTIAHVLCEFGHAALSLMRAAGVRVIPMLAHERFADVCPTFHNCSALEQKHFEQDALGAFGPQEMTVYLRSHLRGTILHEAGHAIDASLGGGSYFSNQLYLHDTWAPNPIHALYASTTTFVSTHARTHVTEYFAEAIRAWFDGRLVNDGNLRERLQRDQPALATYLDDLFTSEIPRRAALLRNAQLQHCA